MIKATGGEFGMASPFARKREYVRTDGKPKKKLHPKIRSGKHMAAAITANAAAEKDK